MSITKTIYIEVEGQEAINEVNQINDSLDETTDITDEVAAGALAAAGNFKIMGVSINQVTGALKKFKITLISTGIGAIAVAVGTLAAAFLDTQKGVDALNSVLVPLGYVLDSIWGVVQNLGTGLFEMVSGDVVQGWNTMSGAVENLGIEMAIAYEKGQRLYDLQIQIRDNEINQITAVALLNKQLAENRQLAEDRSKTFEERKTAIDKVIESENALLEIQQNILASRIEAIKLEQDANDTSSEEFKERIALEAQMIDLETTRANGIRRATNIRNALLAEYAETPLKDKVDPLTGLTLNDLAVIETETEVHLDNMNALYAGYAEQQERIASETATDNINSAEAEKEARVAALETTGQALVQMSIIAGKESKAGKALAVSAILVSAAVASIKLWEAYAPGGPWALPAAIAHQALIAASTVAALSQVNNSDSGSASTVGSGGGSAPAPSFNVVGASQSSSLEQTLLSQGVRVSQDTPIKSYVVASDVTTMQSLDRQVEANAGV